MADALPAGAFVLRPFVAADAPAFAAAVRESAASVGAWMGWAHAGFSEADALTWFAACDAGRASGSAHEFGIFRADDGSLAGGAGLNQINTVNGFCNLGYWVRTAAQRQGVAVAAVAALARFGFAELGLTRIEIVIADGNDASMAVARKAGAVYEYLSRNRLKLRGEPVAGHMFALLPARAGARPD